MKVLVLQHERVEDPGMFRAFLERDGHEWRAVQLQEGEALPAVDGFDALWVMGGPMDVWETDAHPWLDAEKAFIREAVKDRAMPFLGLCLGHQLLAEALGGECGVSETPEVGVMDVRLTEHGTAGGIFDGAPETFRVLQWHGAEVKRMPPGARCLATAPACAIQAMQWGPRAYSAQFHVEVEPDTVGKWSEVPAYSAALRKALGANGVARLSADCERDMPAFNELAERLYVNWRRIVAL